MFQNYVRCRLRPVKEAETEKNNQKNLWRKKGRKHYHTLAERCVWYECDASSFFQRNTDENKSNENCFYMPLEKDGWLIAIVLLSQAKLPSPPLSAPSDVPDDSNLSIEAYYLCISNKSM